MVIRLRSMGLLLSATLILFAQHLFAQSFTGSLQATFTAPELASTLTTYEVYRIDANMVDQHARKQPNGGSYTFQLGSRQWAVSLEPSGIVTANYSLQLGAEKSASTMPPTTWQGYEKSGNGAVRLTFASEFIYGYVMQGGERWYIQPVWHVVPGADRDLFVVYPESGVIDTYGGTCAVQEEKKVYEEYLKDVIKEQLEAAEAKSLACYEVALALASDNSMLTKYGSIGSLEARNAGVINDVEGDYASGNFNHDVQFNIVIQFVPAGNDPWTNSTDSGVLLNSFTNWGNGGNFGVQYDLAQLWTNRNLDGSVIGIAWLNGICNNNRYSVCQDFSNNADLIRVLTSHEFGHNFSLVHDNNCPPPNFIMCPSVSNTMNWSTQSINTMNNKLNSLINNGCISPCGANPPLEANFEWNPDPACQNQSIQFTDLSAGNITSRAWTFPSGNPATSNQQNPVVTWNTSGTFNVKLVVTGPSGSTSITKPVTVIAQPVANFSYVVNGTTVTFTNLSTPNNNVTYSWEFGDGNFSLDKDPVHTYAVGGFYTVELTVTNDCGSSTKTVLVNTAPTADFSANPSSGCAPLIVQFTDESSPNTTSWVWQFPGGTPSSSNQQNPVVSYSVSGSYDVTLKAINFQGSSTVTKSNFILVENVPNANFSSSINGKTVTFTNLSVNATSYLWNFGDGNTSTLINPVHTYAVGGTYVVTLTATNPCGNTVSTKTIVIVSPPVAAFSANDTSGCAPLSVQFTNQSTGNIDSIRWSFPGGTPLQSALQTVNVTYNTPGTYSVTLIAYGPGGNDTLTKTNWISVGGVPAASFTQSVVLNTVTFTNTTLNGSTYLWNFGDGNTSTLTNPVHVYANDGVYTVTLTATNACGSNTTTKQITIVTLPVADFTASPTSGCGPLTVQFTNTSSPNATTFNWQFPGGTPSSSTAQNPSVVYSTPGVYSVTLTASNAAGSNTATKTNYITVNTTPVANFTSSINGATVTFTNTSQGATSYLWAFGDNNTSSLANPVHTYANDGVYTVTLTATNACGNTTTTQQVTIVTPPVAAFTGNPTSGCAPLSVQFTNNSSPNATTFNWQFPGGTPSSSTAQNPLVLYNTPGVYSVTLTASNAAGSNTVSITNYINVGTVPVAGFTSSINGATVTFTNTSQGATSYLWAFGDNNTSNLTNPVHNYANDGVYTVTLTATNACGSNTTTQQVTIVTPPVAAFTGNPTNGCAPLTVQFTNNSSPNATTFNWQFPGGSPGSSTAQNPSVVYSTPGVYSVTLTASNAAGSNTATQTNYINVGTVPVAGFTRSANGATVTFTNTSTGGTSYLWDFGDNTTSNLTDPVHTYANDGVYTVTLTATNACGSNTTTQQVTIVTPPVAGFSMGGDGTGCAPLTVQFTNNSSDNATSYKWTFQNGTPDSSTEENPSSTWSTPGAYLVTLVATNAAGSTTFTDTVVVNSLPTASFNYQLAGLSVVFSNLSQGANQFEWTFGDGGTSNEVNPTHTYVQGGMYNVRLRATNACGQSEFNASVEIIGAAPIAAFSASEISGCSPFSVQFTDQSAGNPISWNWTFQGGNPSTSKLQNPLVQYNTPGVFTVVLEATNQFGVNEVIETNFITVNSFPTVGFTHITAGGLVTFTNLSQNASNFLWNFGDGNISNLANPTHTYAASGTYTVSLTATNECGAATLEQVVQVNIVGTEQPEWVKHFRIFPNPNTGAFTVDMSGANSDEIEFTLYNELGQLVKRDVLGFQAGNLIHHFDYTGLPSAMYSLHMKAGGHAWQVKMVVQQK